MAGVTCSGCHTTNNTLESPSTFCSDYHKNYKSRLTVVCRTWPSKVERVTTTMSYLRKRLTLIFTRKIQAGKNIFLKITALYKSTFSNLFYRSISFHK